MTTTEKLSDLKKRIDDALWQPGEVLPASFGDDGELSQITLSTDRLNILDDAAHILSRLIGRFPEKVSRKDCTDGESHAYVFGKNDMRQKILDIITGDEK